jgi:hypothetical protein
MYSELGDDGVIHDEANKRAYPLTIPLHNTVAADGEHDGEQIKRHSC